MKRTYLALIMIVVSALTIVMPTSAAPPVVVDTCTEGALNSALSQIMDDGGTIEFTCSGTIALTGQKTFSGRNNDYEIIGNGVVTLDAGGNDRIFLVPPGHNNSLTLSGLTLTNGYVNEAMDTDIPNGGQGGAIFFHYGNRRLEIYDSTFTNNVSDGNTTFDGGGVLHIRNADWLQVENSVFTGNQAPNGGVMNILITPGYLTNNQYINNVATSVNSGGGGAIYIDNGSLTFANSLFQGNQAGSLGGGYFNAGGSANIAGETIINSYFVDNIAGAQGGGIYTVDDRFTVTGSTFDGNEAVTNGGGLAHESKNNTSFTATIANSTFTGNLSGNGRLQNPDPDAAFGNGGAIVNSGAAAMTVVQTTIADNRTGVQGSAIRTGGGPVILIASIIVNNTSSFQWINEQCYGDVRDGGGNIQYPAQDPVWGREARCFTNRPVSADPGLLALADNGGATPTRAIPSNSSAVDVAACTAGVITDQREMLRPQGLRCDAGAFEVRTGTPPNMLVLNGDLAAAPAKPTFQWADNTNGEWYNIIVAGDENGLVFNEWREASVICSADTCSLTDVNLYPDWGLLNDNYNWWVQSWSGTNGFIATDPQPFVVEIPAPEILTGTAPADQETDTDGNVTFAWDEDTNTLWYNIYILGPNYAVDEWYAAEDICEADTCAMPSRTLSNGEYQWYLRGWGPGGFGDWTDGSTVFVGAAPPSVIVPTGPGGTISTPSVTFEWQADENAQWYQVYVQGPNGVINQWFAAEDTTISNVTYTGVCDMGTCTVPATISNWWLTDGDYQWWIAGWGAGGFGEWDLNGMTFTLNAPAPSVVTTQSPADSASVPEGTVALTWDEDANAAWYNLYLQGGGQIVNEWYEAGEVCAEGACTVDLNLSAGSHDWYMRSWGAGGMADFNTGITFTVQ